MVERIPVKDEVVGSNPTKGASKRSGEDWTRGKWNEKAGKEGKEWDRLGVKRTGMERQERKG
jgi:hypothetical protein